MTSCPTCGTRIANDPGEVVECVECGKRWRPLGLRNKYEVLRRDERVDAPVFVLVLTDPAARVAALAYAAATRNSLLGREIRAQVARIEARPDDYPAPGQEGRVNRGVHATVSLGELTSSMIIFKTDADAQEVEDGESPVEEFSRRVLALTSGTPEYQAFARRISMMGVDHIMGSRARIPEETDQ